nr:peroxide stress protein YaaA [Peptoniphilus rachelemmaiella]
MKSIIILSPSKEMDFALGDQLPALDEAAKKILGALQRMSLEALAAQLQLSGEQARIIYDATQKAALPTAKAAADTYRGLAFRQMDREILLSPFARDRVRILSALYGPSPPMRPSIPIGWISPKA